MSTLLDRMLALWEKPGGRTVRVQITDILTVRDGRIADIWMMAADLSLLMQLGAVSRLGDPAARG
jgi:hypothetical protein